MRRSHLTMLGVLIGLVLAIPAVVLASHRFTDVPTSSSFHDDISWLADAGVTLGCDASGTAFCPTDAVSRQQMAAFMRRLAQNEVVNADTANSADVAGTATNATRADDADLLDGRARESLLSNAGGIYGGFDELVTLATSDPVTLYSSSHTASAAQATSLINHFSGVLTLTMGSSPLASDHQLVCWISEVELLGYDGDLTEASFAWITMPAGTHGVSGTNYQWAQSFAISHGTHLDPGETVTLFYQCADLFADSAADDEYFAALGRVHGYQLIDDADSFSSPAGMIGFGTDVGEGPQG